MGQARALVPYALVALLVVTGTTLALALAIRDDATRRDAVRAVATSTLAPASVRPAVPALSLTGRLAYWRGDGSSAELFASNLDGSQRRSLARAENVRRIALTRWTADGEAVTFVESGLVVHVVRLDGAARRIPLPEDLVSRGYRVTDVRWSPDGSRVAATVLRPELRGDVHIVSIADGTWTRATTLDDAFVADWLSPDDLLVATGGGVVAIHRVGTENALRPLTGMAATSPIVGDDGRIHFVAGSVTQLPRDATLPHLSASSATVWSVNADGGDLRQETRAQLDDVRIDALLGPARYLAHRGSSPLQVVLGETVIATSIDAGAVERVAIAPDRRTAFGFTGTRIVRFDLTRTGGAFATPLVFLDNVSGGDVWYPRSVQLARGRDPVPSERPEARYAFSFGGSIWTMGADGVGALLRARPPSLAPPRRGLPIPPWSPKGDRVLTIEVAGPGIAGLTQGTSLPLTVDRDGTITRHLDGRASANVVAWSPDADAFAVIVDRRGVDAFVTQAQLEARFLTLDGKAARAPMPAREVAWGRGGVVLLTDDAVDLVRDDAQRTVVRLATLANDPRGEFPASADRLTTTYANLGASPDGAWISLRIAISQREGASRFALALVRAADGFATAFLRGDVLSDPTWSPGRARFGYTIGSGREQFAEVRDPSTAGVIAKQSGRFAGWSPDGGWYYVARQTGLFAYKLAGGDGVRVSAMGVVVSTTAP